MASESVFPTENTILYLDIKKKKKGVSSKMGKCYCEVNFTSEIYGFQS